MVNIFVIYVEQYFAYDEHFLIHGELFVVIYGEHFLITHNLFKYIFYSMMDYLNVYLYL